MLRAPTKKPIVLPAVRPNEGVEAAYRKKLDALIDDMQASIVYWLQAAYRANTPEMAQDDSPAMQLRATMRKLTRRWQKNFDAAAPGLAKYFATKASARADGQLEAILKKAGFSVEFKMTDAANDVLQATIGENIGLIKSIASQHLSEVEGLVMRSVTAGRDLSTVSKELQERFGVTKRRAALIARDQNNRATASVTRVRQESLGITQAKWMHSHGGRHPRPSHVAADGKVYDVSQGMLIDGEYIWPGKKIGCRCVSKSLIPGF